MKVTGILSISNGSGLQYPYPVVVHSLQRMCDNVIVGVDPNFPLDRQTIEGFDLDDAVAVDSVWDRKCRGNGTEIAFQMDKLVAMAGEQGSDWVVVVQADEMFHDNDFSMLRLFMERNLHTNVNGFSTERLYFWKDLATVRADWNADLVRIFRPGTYSFLAEGTSKDGMFSAPTAAGEEIKLPYKLYHYSRVDPDPAIISQRVRNLDTFFHEEKDLVPEAELPKYDFVPRTHDNYSTREAPTVVVGSFSSYEGTHPVGIREWYNV